MKQLPPITWLAVVVLVLTIWMPSTVTAGKQIAPVSSEPDMQKLKYLELFHASIDSCAINRWSYYNDKYYVLGKEKIASELNITNALGTCNPDEQVILFELNRFYVIQRNPNKANRASAPYRISTHKIYFDGKAPQELAPSAPTVSQTFENLVAPPANCFIDLGNLMCIAEHGPDGNRERIVFRFIKQSTAFTFVGYIRITNKQRHLSTRVIFDPFRRELFELRPASSDISGNFKRRQIIDFHSDGGSMMPPFVPSKMVSAISRSGEGVHVVIGEDGQSKYTFYKYGPWRRQWSNEIISTHDWEELSDGKQMAVLFNAKYSNTENDASILMTVATKRCENLQKKINRCQADLSSANSISTVLFVVAGILMFFFIILTVLLALYLLCCIKTKRRRHRKRKRKHRRHPKVQINKPEEEQKKGGSEEDVEMDPNATSKGGDNDKKEEAKTKKEENKIIKKLKAFGGVDYSASSSDSHEIEHSQAYFSARDQFDDKGSAISPVGSTNNTNPPPPPLGGDNNYENLGPQSGAPADADTNTDGHGGVPEPDIGQVSGGVPRSVYMKPAKKKKK